MKENIFGILIVLFVLVVAGITYILPRFQGIKPVVTPPPESIVDIIEKHSTDNPAVFATTSVPMVTSTQSTSTHALPMPTPVVVNATDFPLTLPPNFRIEVFAKNAKGARVMAFDSHGDLWVSRMSEGIVTFYDIEDGKVVGQKDIFKKLKSPHGLALSKDGEGFETLYIAEEDKISAVVVRRDGAIASTLSDIEQVEGSIMVSSFIEPHKMRDLTETGGVVRHKSRTLGFGPDGRLYVSIGSSCNVCDEESSLRGKIFSMNKDGSDWREEARGLRNAVFFTWSEVDGRMWATEMGRDGLGDELPPDELNLIVKDGNYGWPVCYGKNIHDTDFDKKTYIRNPCMEPFEKPSTFDLGAHVAPLGLDFVPEEGWPEEYWYNLLVAYHGSWNKKEPAGYKIARIKMDAKGNILGEEDFISGFLTKNNKALGRPVDIVTQPGGVMYISDDHAGVIYRVFYTGSR